MPHLFLSREWRRLHADPAASNNYTNIRGVSAENTVLNTTYQRLPGSEYRRKRLGGDRGPLPCPPSKRLTDNKWVHLASLTSKKSPFKHKCYTQFGSYGKILYFTQNIIRAGRSTPPDALLGVMTFLVAIQGNYPTALLFPNQVLSGTLVKKLDPEKLKTDPSINWSSKFPGFGINLKNHASTPELYAGPIGSLSKPSTFIIPGNLKPHALKDVLESVNRVTVANSTEGPSLQTQ